MKIVHLFPWDKAFSINWIQYIDTYFGEASHSIVLYEKMTEEDCQQIISYKNVYMVGTAKECFFSGVNETVEHLLNDAESIVLHYASFYMMLAVAKKSAWLRKTRIVCWGGDIEILKKKGFGSIQKTKDFIQKRITTYLFERVGKVGFLIDEDRCWVQKVVPNIKEASVISYLSKMRSDRDCWIDFNAKGNDEIRILLGNSATESNNHFEIIEKLQKYTNSYKLYVPLSYGDMEYGEKVIQFGKELLGERFVPIRNFMPEKDYLRLLSSMHIAIFNHKRQQGLGNINIALQSKDKVYLNPESPCWEHYKKEGYHISSVELIGDIPFKDFCYMSDTDLEENRRLLLKQDESFRNNIIMWKKFMS